MADELIGDDGLTEGDRELIEELRARLVMKNETATSWRLADDRKTQQLMSIACEESSNARIEERE